MSRVLPRATVALMLLCALLVGALALHPRADAASATLVVASAAPLPIEAVRDAVEEAGYELAHG